MSSSNVENFILRVLAGFDPKDLTPLKKRSVWLSAGVQTAFRELLSPETEEVPRLNYETFFLRVLAGLDPISMTALPEDSVWLSSHIQDNFRELIVLPDKPLASSDDGEGLVECVFPF